MCSEKIIELSRYKKEHRERMPERLARRGQAARGELVDLEAMLRVRTELAIQRVRKLEESSSPGLARSAGQPQVQVTTWRRAASSSSVQCRVSVDPMAIAERLLDRLLPSD
jgi:hypothetical protein